MSRNSLTTSLRSGVFVTVRLCICRRTECTRMGAVRPIGMFGHIGLAAPNAFWRIRSRQATGLSFGRPPCLLLFLLLVIGLDRAGQLDRQRVAVAILGLANLDPNPSFADAVFADILLLDALEADADVALDRVGVVERTARIVR